MLVAVRGDESCRGYPFSHVVLAFSMTLHWIPSRSARAPRAASVPFQVPSFPCPAFHPQPLTSHQEDSLRLRNAQRRHTRRTSYVVTPSLLSPSTALSLAGVPPHRCPAACEAIGMPLFAPPTSRAVFCSESSRSLLLLALPARLHTSTTLFPTRFRFRARRFSFCRPAATLRCGRLTRFASPDWSAFLTAASRSFPPSPPSPLSPPPDFPLLPLALPAWRLSPLPSPLGPRPDLLLPTESRRCAVAIDVARC